MKKYIWIVMFDGEGSVPNCPVGAFSKLKDAQNFIKECLETDRQFAEFEGDHVQILINRKDVKKWIVTSEDGARETTKLYIYEDQIQLD